MKLIDAILSGRPFREILNNTPLGCWWKLGRIEFVPHPDVCQVHTGPQWRDVRALTESDYETVALRVSITQDEFYTAIKKVLYAREKRTGISIYPPAPYLHEEDIGLFAKELGFK